jgi:hypothetical protein
MSNNVTDTVWSHLDGGAISGELQGTQLQIMALQTTTWASWVTEHPQTTVTAIDTGYRYRQTTVGRGGLSRTFQKTLPELDNRLSENTLVIGVLAGGESRAFPIVGATFDAPMQDSVNDIPLVILEDADRVPSLAYHRALTDGRVLDFERRDGAVFDVQTGSRWGSDGLAIEGELAGVQLTFVISFFTEWYGWAAFHP